ncbi:MAG: trehalase family glycosidase [Candidatus Sumerlaeia bacterium]
MDSVRKYIEENWDRAVYRDKDGSGFRGIDLPYPYSSPCIKGEGKFYFFFYWDTYFTNLGLLASGREDIAKANIQNMLWLIDRQGYMPNHVGIYNRSQPPYLCRMVREYLDATGDEAFLDACAEGLRREYQFWMNARYSRTGLNGYGSQETSEGCVQFYDSVMTRRLGMPGDVPDAEKEIIGGHYLAEAETGWDFNQRFDGRCDEHNATCLNSLVYELEEWLAGIAAEKNRSDRELMWERLEQRKERINRYLWNEEKGWFFDYDFVNEKQSPVVAICGLQMLSAGIASPEQAARVRESLPLLERDHGIAVTEDRPECRNYQWAFPNVWPPMVYMAVDGLRRYGFDDDAKRIAQKYIDTTRRLFEKTGQLWEKTDAETGDIAGGEYDAAPMLGWSAGVYLALLEYVG